MLQRYLRQTGFRHQLTVIFTTAILGLALFSSLMNSWKASQSMRGYMLEQGQRIAENLARQSTLALLYHSADNARDAVATTLAFPDVVQVEISDATHKVLLSKSKFGGPRSGETQYPLTVAINRAMLEEETGDAWHFGAPVYGGGQIEESPFEVQEHKPQLLGFVHVALGKETLNRLVTSLFWGNLTITFSFAVILLGIMRLLAQRMIHPLNALSNLMRRAEEGESGIRAEPDGPKDIIEMASAFNKMMNVLEDRETELKHSRDEAVRLAQIKSQFATTVSHELRTPLNGVVGMLDMLKETPLTKRQQECVDVAWRSAYSLVELINDILDFSKMDAGKLELEEIDFDLQKLLEDVVELLAKQAQLKNLDLGYLIAADIPRYIKSDPLRLRQILINLLGNALKFTVEGEVALRVTCTEREGDHFSLCFEVTDTGIGMKEEAARTIFESFAQADNSTTRKYGGTGLGLAICKQIVGLMGGEVKVRTQLGIGTTFWFTVRCKASHIVFNEKKTALSGRVLIIDPSTVVRDFLVQNLEHYGLVCKAVNSGPEALKELVRAQEKEVPYNLVITEISLESEPALSLVRAIRLNEAISKVHLLGLDRNATLMSHVPAGVDGYLVKPLQLSRLINTVRPLLSGEEKPRLSTAAVSHDGPIIPKGYRVLVADDNRTNQMVAARMLTMNGCVCDFAANGKEAFEAARTHYYDLILMDCSMPEMDGYEATMLIRQHEASLGRHTLVIALTANTQPGDEERCRSAGMDDYLSKPVTLAGLRQKLEKWLAQQNIESSGAVAVEGAGTQHGALDQVIFNTMWETLGSALEQSITAFLENVSASLEELEESVSKGETNSIQTVLESIHHSRENISAMILHKVANDFKDRPANDIQPILLRLRRAFSEVTSTFSKRI